MWEFETSLPTSDSFRTSLIMPKMMERFSILQKDDSKVESVAKVQEVIVREDEATPLTGEEDYRVLGHRTGSSRLFSSTQREWRTVEPLQRTIPKRGRSMSLNNDTQQSDTDDAAEDDFERKEGKYKKDSPVHYSIQSQSIHSPILKGAESSSRCSPNPQKSLAPSPIPDTAPLHVEKGTLLRAPKQEKTTIALCSLVAQHLRDSKSETESSRPTTAYLDEEVETVWDHHYQSAPTENKLILTTRPEGESPDVTTLQIPELPKPRATDRLPVISAALPFSISQSPLGREEAHARESSEEWDIPEEPVTPEYEPADVEYAGRYGSNSLAQSYDRLRAFEAEINHDAHWRQGHCLSTPSPTPRKIKRSSPPTASPGTLEAIPEDHVVTPNASPRRSPAQSRSSSSTVPSAELTVAYPFGGMSTPPNRMTGSRSQPSLHSSASTHSTSSSSSSPDMVREVFSPASMASSPSTPPVSKRKVDKRDIGTPVFLSTSNVTAQTRPVMSPKSQPRITSWRENLQAGSNVGVRLF